MLDQLQKALGENFIPVMLLILSWGAMCIIIGIAWVIQEIGKRKKDG